MFCRNCGRELAEGTQVCPECGEVLISQEAIDRQNEAAGEAAAPREQVQKAPESGDGFRTYSFSDDYNRDHGTTGAQEPARPQEPTGYSYDPKTGNYTYYGTPAYDTEGYGQQPYQDKGRGAAIASLVCGVLSVLLCCLSPIVNVPLAVAGIICGIFGLRSSQKTMAVVGIILSVIGILLGIIVGLATLGMISDESFMQEILKEIDDYARIAL